jgi:hypothetical protein
LSAIDTLPTPWRTQMWVQVKDSRRGRSRGTLFSSQHFKGQRGVLELREGTKKSWQASLTHTGLHTTHTKWLVHSWNTFGARMSHGQQNTLNSPRPGLGGSQHLPLFIVYSVARHGAYIQMVFLSRDSRVGVPKSCQMGL